MTPRVLALLVVLVASSCTAAVLASGCASFGEGRDEATSKDASVPSSNDATPSVPDGPLADDACGTRFGPPLFVARFDAPAPRFEFEELFDSLDPGEEDFEGVPSAGLDGNALRVTVGAGAGSSHNRWLRRIFTVDLETKNRVRLDFDFIVEESGHDYAVLGGLFFYGDSPPVPDHAVALRARGQRLDESTTGGLPMSAPFFDTEVVGKPHHAVVCVLREGQTTNVRRVVLIDGTPVDDRAGLSLEGASGFDVRIGVFYTSQEDATTRVVYDDVEVRVD